MQCNDGSNNPRYFRVLIRGEGQDEKPTIESAWKAVILEIRRRKDEVCVQVLILY